MKSLLFTSPFILSALACASQASTPSNEPSDLAVEELGTELNATASTEFDVAEFKIATEPNLAMAMIEADGKFHIWMEGRSGLLRVEPANTFWLEQGGVTLRQGKGQRHLEIDGHTFFTPGVLSKVALGEKFNSAPKNTSGYAISLEMTSKGKYITSLTSQSKRPIRIASTIQKPSRSAIYSIANSNNNMGTATPALASTVLTEIKTNSALPATTTAIAFGTAKPEQVSAWNTEMKNIFGGTANVEWSGTINLDGKEGDENIVCTPTKEENTCFVVITIDGMNRYYHTDFKWNGKDKPQAFTVDTGVYVYHKSPLKKGFVNKVLTFDGSGYSSIQL